MGQNRNKNNGDSSLPQKLATRKNPPFGGGGGSNPSLIFSCFSFSISRRRWVRIFFLSFFVNMMGRDGASLGSAKQRSQMLIHEWVLLYERWTLWNQLSNILKKKNVYFIVI